MKLALVSLNQVWEDKAANKRQVSKYLKLAAERDVDVIVFPEMTLTGFSMNTNLIAEDDRNSESVLFFKELSKGFEVVCIFGVVLSDGKRTTNNLVVTSNDGAVAARYEKIHTFSMAQEDRHYSSGRALAWTELDGVKIGLTICYDLRFPEMFQVLSRDAQVIVNIANWPEKRIAAWETLLKARAIENQIFVVGVNRVGNDPKDNFYPESSLAFDPMGEKVISIGRIGEMDVVEIDEKQVFEVRKKLPFKRDRRDALYAEMLNQAEGDRL